MGEWHTVSSEVVEVTDEQVLAETVRAWANRELPGEPGVANQAASVAEASYAEGASIADACEWGRAFVGSWTRHPAHRKADQDMVLRLVV